jgi:hypothetical protein
MAASSFAMAQTLLVGQSGEQPPIRGARHTEVSDELARKICGDLGISPP